MRRPNYSKARADHIIASEEEMKSKARGLQKLIYSTALDYLLTNLVISDNSVEDTLQNYRIASKVGRYVDRELSSNKSKFISWMVRKANEIISINKKYFASFGLTDQVYIDSKKKTLAYLGVQKTKDRMIVQSDGYLSDLFDFSTITSSVKSMARTEVGNKASDVTLFKKALKGKVVGGDKLGLVERRFDEVARDVFPLIDRSIGNNLSDKLNIEAYIYQGGLIKTSRPFCVARNNKVFTREEIASWKELDFQGKPDNYNPFVHMGGHNCRHQLDPISKELAIQLRPELKDIWGL